MLKLKQRTLFSNLAIALALIASFSVANADEIDSVNATKISLFDALSRARNEQEGRIAESAIWEFWFDQSPTPEIRESLDAGMERRETYDFEGAENHLDKVVELAPAYAEGYNQRAFVRFLRENYEDSKTDLETVLELEPDHFGALSGLYHILRIQNRQKPAMRMLQQAVAIHPWIQERAALPKELWPKSYRDIHDPGQEI